MGSVEAVSEAAISVRGLRKSYGEHEAVRGIDFEVAAGEVFGFLGPNGAGKTTTIEILEGYRERSGGEVAVLGVDPGEPTRAWRSRVGLVLQECELDPLLTVREAVCPLRQLLPRAAPGRGDDRAGRPRPTSATRGSARSPAARNAASTSRSGSSATPT